jgi:hypothetical protein
MVMINQLAEPPMIDFMRKSDEVRMNLVCVRPEAFGLFVIGTQDE